MRNLFAQTYLNISGEWQLQMLWNHQKLFLKTLQIGSCSDYRLFHVELREIFWNSKKNVQGILVRNWLHEFATITPENRSSEMFGGE